MELIVTVSIIFVMWTHTIETCDPSTYRDSIQYSIQHTAKYSNTAHTINYNVSVNTIQQEILIKEKVDEFDESVKVIIKLKNPQKCS